MKQKNREQNQERPSKSAKKRESAGLQKLGEELAGLSPETRKELELPQELLDALAMHDKIRDREGARRQRQYIGKIMRGLDSEAIARKLAERKLVKAAHIFKFHNAEKLREKIMTCPDEKLGTVLESICSEKNDLIRLAELANAARQEGDNPKVKAARRELFRFLASSSKKA